MIALIEATRMKIARIRRPIQASSIDLYTSAEEAELLIVSIGDDGTLENKIDASQFFAFSLAISFMHLTWSSQLILASASHEKVLLRSNDN